MQRGRRRVPSKKAMAVGSSLVKIINSTTSTTSTREKKKKEAKNMEEMIVHSIPFIHHVMFHLGKSGHSSAGSGKEKLPPSCTVLCQLSYFIHDVKEVLRSMPQDVSLKFGCQIYCVLAAVDLRKSFSLVEMKGAELESYVENIKLKQTKQRW